MAPHPAVLYPDPRLRQKADPVLRWDDALEALALVIRLESEAKPRIYVNPEVLWTSPEVAAHTEGSVSVPRK